MDETNASNSKTEEKTRGDQKADENRLTENSRFSERYVLDKELGHSNFSVVRRGLDRMTGKKIAVKCIAQSLLTLEDQTALKVEASILKEVEHHNICKFYDLVEESDMFYLLTEYIEGSSLLERIVKKEFYPEAEARSLILTVANALNYCHQRNIIHRNLVRVCILVNVSSCFVKLSVNLAIKKPGSILFDGVGNVKLAFFGFSKHIANVERPNVQPVGMSGYVAPEILSGNEYCRATDMWSLGVLTFVLFTGSLPFLAKHQQELLKEGEAKYDFDPSHGKDISENAKDVVKRLLVVDVSERLTVEAFLQHPWLNMDGEESDARAAIRQNNSNAPIGQGKQIFDSGTQDKGLHGMTLGGEVDQS